MNYTKGKWEIGTYGNHKFEILSDRRIAQVDRLEDAHLISACPDMYEALKLANELITVARSYFPKSIQNLHRFQLENICATINVSLSKAEGK